MLQVMGRDVRDLALASLDINLEPDEKIECLRELQSLNELDWYRCEFRNCDLLLIYGGDKVLEKENISWTGAAERCPTLRSLVGKIVSPFFSPYHLPSTIFSVSIRVSR